MGTKRDANDVLRNQGIEALRKEHDTAVKFDPDSDGDIGPDIEFADEISLEKATNYVVKGLISAGSIAILYGPSSAGKTFLALELALCVAHGKPFFGRNTKRAAVLYVALEGQANLGQRIIATRKSHGCPGKLLARLRRTIILGRDMGSKAGVASIIEAAKHVAEQAGFVVALIIIDTLARALGADNENEAGCISAVMTQLGQIVTETGAAVLLIHHPGKDRDKGLRGSSALFAAADAVISVERQGGMLGQVDLVKTRDGVEGPVGAFALRPVALGIDPDGEPITSCVVEPREGIRGAGVPRPRQNTAAGKALNELEHLMIDGKGEISLGHQRIPDNVMLIKRADWQAACAKRRLSEGDSESEKRVFRRAVSLLSARNLVGDYGNSVWLIGARGQDTPAGLKNNQAIQVLHGKADNPDRSGQPPDLSAREAERTTDTPL